MEYRLAELKRKRAKKDKERRYKRKTLKANDRKELNKQVTKLRRNNKLKSMIGFKPMTEEQIQKTAFKQIILRKKKRKKKKYTESKNPNTRNNLLQNLRTPFKRLEIVKVDLTTPQRLPTPREFSRKTGSKRYLSTLVSNALRRATRRTTRRANTA